MRHWRGHHRRASRDPGVSLSGQIHTPAVGSGEPPPLNPRRSGTFPVGDDEFARIAVAACAAPS